MRYRGLVLAVVVLVMIPGVAAAAMQGHAFYVQKARNLVFSDLGLGEPAQYERLVSLIRGEDYLEAAVLLEDILDAESRTSALRQASLAYLWAAGGDQGLALEIFNNVDNAPAHLQVPLARALCLHDLGRLAEAAAVFTAVASSSSDSGESRLAAWNALVDYREAAGSYVKRPDEGVPQLVYDYRNAYEELAGLFEWGAAEMPRERLLADLAETLGRYGLYAAAGDLWRRVLEAPLPEDAGAEELSRAYAAVKLADLSRQSGAYTSAAAWLERALELAETEELRRYAQNQLEALQTAAQGRVAEAVIRGVPESEEAARLARQRIDNLLVDENAPTPYLSAAELAFAELVDIDMGQRYLERALQENESPARVVALAGEAAYALTRVGDYEAADDLYGLALSVDPGNEPLVYAHRLNAVRLALADERLGEAVDSLYGLLGNADSGTRLEAAFILLELGREHQQSEWIWSAVHEAQGLSGQSRVPLLLGASEAFLLETEQTLEPERLRELRNEAVVALGAAIQQADDDLRTEIRIRSGDVFAAFALAIESHDPAAAAKDRDKARRAWERARETAVEAGDERTVAEIDRRLAELPATDS